MCSWTYILNAGKLADEHPLLKTGLITGLIAGAQWLIGTFILRLVLGFLGFGALGPVAGVEFNGYFLL